jgi:hypothetical protein
MELNRALSDLEEVRGRLARIQRFEGYSAPAAAASGAFALTAGIAQARVAPFPPFHGQVHTYLTIWFLCAGAALAINYGAAAIWLLCHRSAHDRSQFRSAAASIAPSVILGAAITVALCHYGAYALLPGTWFALYAIGLFASRTQIPDGSIYVTIGFAALAVAFLATPLVDIALTWWVVPLGFAFGQLAIGALLWESRRHA